MDGLAGWNRDRPRGAPKSTIQIDRLTFVPQDEPAVDRLRRVQHDSEGDRLAGTGSRGRLHPDHLHIAAEAVGNRGHIDGHNPAGAFGRFGIGQ